MEIKSLLVGDAVLMVPSGDKNLDNIGSTPQVAPEKNLLEMKTKEFLFGMKELQ
jgi:hypothetical protein